MSTTTTTTTSSDAAPTMRVPNPLDSMKSTWRNWDRSEWKFSHWMFEWLDIHQTSLNKEVPVHKKTEKVPHLPEWKTHRWILVHGFIPLAIHQAWLSLGGPAWSAVAVWMFYQLAFAGTKFHELQALRRLGLIHGYLDGDKHARDEVPDHGVAKTWRSLEITAVLRMLLMTLLTYDKEQGPLQMNWAWLPLELGLYGIILDFWFYWYHRVMHDNDGLWKYHRTHHLTKHPNALLTLYADEVQEAFDIAGIPLITWFSMRFMGFPMGFYEWFLCGEYVTFAELAGHSGLRIMAGPPSTLGWLLRYFDCDLIIEDHDLHHRKGWKSSHNYGKQTRLWDRVFGTLLDRVECTKDNIDYDNTVEIPLLFKRV